MSQENVEMIERMLDQAQRNPAALAAILDDEVRWELGIFDLPDAAAGRRGPASVSEFFRRWIGPFDEWGYEVGEVIDAGDSVVVHIHQWGRGKGSGAVVDNRFWQAWTIRDGKVVQVTHHPEKAQALKAVGLRE
jgi:ketosteroid isomerase-like protein